MCDNPEEDAFAEQVVTPMYDSLLTVLPTISDSDSDESSSDVPEVVFSNLKYEPTSPGDIAEEPLQKCSSAEAETKPVESPLQDDVRSECSTSAKSHNVGCTARVMTCSESSPNTSSDCYRVPDGWQSTDTSGWLLGSAGRLADCRDNHRPLLPTLPAEDDLEYSQQDASVVDKLASSKASAGPQLSALGSTAQLPSLPGLAGVMLESPIADDDLDDLIHRLQAGLVDLAELQSSASTNEAAGVLAEAPLATMEVSLKGSAAALMEKELGLQLQCATGSAVAGDVSPMPSPTPGHVQTSTVPDAPAPGGVQDPPARRRWPVSPLDGAQPGSRPTPQQDAWGTDDGSESEGEELTLWQRERSRVRGARSTRTRLPETALQRDQQMDDTSPSPPQGVEVRSLDGAEGIVKQKCSKPRVATASTFVAACFDDIDGPEIPDGPITALVQQQSTPAEAAIRLESPTSQAPHEPVFVSSGHRSIAVGSDEAMESSDGDDNEPLADSSRQESSAAAAAESEQATADSDADESGSSQTSQQALPHQLQALLAFPDEVAASHSRPHHVAANQTATDHSGSGAAATSVPPTRVAMTTSTEDTAAVTAVPPARVAIMTSTEDDDLECDVHDSDTAGQKQAGTAVRLTATSASTAEAALVLRSFPLALSEGSSPTMSPREGTLSVACPTETTVAATETHSLALEQQQPPVRAATVSKLPAVSADLAAAAAVLDAVRLQSPAPAAAPRVADPGLSALAMLPPGIASTDCFTLAILLRDRPSAVQLAELVCWLTATPGQPTARASLRAGASQQLPAYKVLSLALAPTLNGHGLPAAWLSRGPTSSAMALILAGMPCESTATEDGAGSTAVSPGFLTSLRAAMSSSKLVKALAAGVDLAGTGAIHVVQGMAALKVRSQEHAPRGTAARDGKGEHVVSLLRWQPQEQPAAAAIVLERAAALGLNVVGLRTLYLDAAQCAHVRHCSQLVPSSEGATIALALHGGGDAVLRWQQQIGPVTSLRPGLPSAISLHGQLVPCTDGGAVVSCSYSPQAAEAELSFFFNHSSSEQPPRFGLAGLAHAAGAESKADAQPMLWLAPPPPSTPSWLALPAATMADIMAATLALQYLGWCGCSLQGLVRTTLPADAQHAWLPDQSHKSTSLEQPVMIAEVHHPESSQLLDLLARNGTHSAASPQLPAQSDATWQLHPLTTDTARASASCRDVPAAAATLQLLRTAQSAPASLHAGLWAETDGQPLAGTHQLACVVLHGTCMQQLLAGFSGVLSSLQRPECPVPLLELVALRYLKQIPSEARSQLAAVPCPQAAHKGSLKGRTAASLPWSKGCVLLAAVTGVNLQAEVASRLSEWQATTSLPASGFAMSGVEYDPQTVDLAGLAVGCSVTQAAARQVLASCFQAIQVCGDDAVRNGTFLPDAGAAASASTPFLQQLLQPHDQPLDALCVLEAAAVSTGCTARLMHLLAKERFHVTAAQLMTLTQEQAAAVMLPQLAGGCAAVFRVQRPNAVQRLQHLVASAGMNKLGLHAVPSLAACAAASQLLFPEPPAPLNPPGRSVKTSGGLSQVTCLMLMPTKLPSADPSLPALYGHDWAAVGGAWEELRAAGFQLAGLRLARLSMSRLTALRDLAKLTPGQLESVFIGGVLVLALARDNAVMRLAMTLANVDKAEQRAGGLAAVASAARASASAAAAEREVLFFFNELHGSSASITRA